MISSTAARCCNTSASRKLSQNPFGPSGQFSGSARKNRNTASPRKISGHALAHEKYRLLESTARIPIKNTISPAQLWLYSDQAMSAAEVGSAANCPGTNADGNVRPSPAACLYVSFVD